MNALQSSILNGSIDRYELRYLAQRMVCKAVSFIFRSNDIRSAMEDTTVSN